MENLEERGYGPLAGMQQAAQGYRLDDPETLPPLQNTTVNVDRATIETPEWIPQEVKDAPNDVTKFNNDNMYGVKGNKIREEAEKQCNDAMKQTTKWLSRDIEDLDRNVILSTKIEGFDSARKMIIDLLDFEPLGAQGRIAEEIDTYINKAAMEILGSTQPMTDPQAKADRVMQVLQETFGSQVNTEGFRNNPEDRVAGEYNDAISGRVTAMVSGYNDQRKRGVSTVTDLDLDIPFEVEDLDVIFNLEVLPEHSTRDSYFVGAKKLAGVMAVVKNVLEVYEEDPENEKLIDIVLRLRKEGVIPYEGDISDSIELLKKRQVTMGKKLKEYQKEYETDSSPHLRFQRTVTSSFQMFVGDGYNSYEDVHAKVQDVISNPEKYTNDEAILVLDAWSGGYSAFAKQMKQGNTVDAIGKRLYNIRRLDTINGKGHNVGNSPFAFMRGEDNASLQMDDTGRVRAAASQFVTKISEQSMAEYMRIRGLTEETITDKEREVIKTVLLSTLQVDEGDGLINFNHAATIQDPIVGAAILGTFLHYMDKHELEGVPTVITQMADNIQDGLLLLDDPKLDEMLAGGTDEAEAVRKRAMTALSMVLQLSQVPPSRRASLARGLNMNRSVFKKFDMLNSLLNTPSTEGEGFFANGFNAIIAASEDPNKAIEMMSAMRSRAGNVVRGVARALTGTDNDLQLDTYELRDGFRDLAQLSLDTDRKPNEKEDIEKLYTKMSKTYALPEKEEEIRDLFIKTVEGLGGGNRIFRKKKFETLQDNPKEGMLLLMAMASKQQGFVSNLMLYTEAYYEGGLDFNPSKLPFEDIFSLNTFLGRERVRFVDGELVGVSERYNESIYDASQEYEDGQLAQRINFQLKRSAVHFNRVNENFKLDSNMPEVRAFNSGLRQSLGMEEDEFNAAIAAATKKVKAKYSTLMLQENRQKWYRKYQQFPTHADIMLNVIHEIAYDRIEAGWSYSGINKAMLQGSDTEMGIKMYPLTVTPALTPGLDGKAGGMDSIQYTYPGDRGSANFAMPLFLYFVEPRQIYGKESFIPDSIEIRRQMDPEQSIRSNTGAAVGLSGQGSAPDFLPGVTGKTGQATPYE